MRLASFRYPRFHEPGRDSFGIVDGERVVDLGSLDPNAADLRSALRRGKIQELASRRNEAASIPVAEVEWLPVIPNPDKILCVGINYAAHRLETGRAEASHPTIFLRLASSQAGHATDLWRPQISDRFDYEGELAVIIGRSGRYIRENDARDYVAGYACYNEATIRDWQRHTTQFTPGKNFPHTGSFGPWMTTVDEIPDASALTLTTRLNGEVMQHAGTDQMTFGIPRLIAYCSSFTRLEAGDVICTGTPGGVGNARTPPVFLKPGDRVEVEISGIGTLSNGVVDEPS